MEYRGAQEFASFAHLLIKSSGDLSLAAASAATDRLVPPRVASVLKSAVAAGTTSDNAWAAPLADYQGIVSNFLGSLSNVGAFDRILADNGFLKVPLKTRLALVSGSAVADEVAEG